MLPTGLQQPRLKSSERGFLTDQVADAQTAMAGTVHDIGDTLQRVADVRSCAKRHPWLVVGCAVAAGFVTGALLTPARRKATEISEANTETIAAPNCQPTTGTKRSLLFSTGITLLGSILQTVVTSVISAAVAGPDQPQGETRSPDESTGDEPNG